MGALFRRVDVQVVIPYLNLAVDAWKDGPSSAAATATATAAPGRRGFPSGADDGDDGAESTAADDDSEEQQSGAELMPKTSQARMMCDALAVLVVATFKINVRVWCCATPPHH